MAIVSAARAIAGVPEADLSGERACKADDTGKQEEVYEISTLY